MKLADGFWNFIKLQEIAAIINGFKTTSNQRTASLLLSEEHKATDEADDLAKALSMKCFKNAADTSRVDPQELLDMPPGPKRRCLIDDISVIVISLDGNIK